MAAIYTTKYRVFNVSEGSAGYAQVHLVEHDIDPTRGRSTGAVTVAVLLEDASKYPIGGLFTVALTEASA